MLNRLNLLFILMIFFLTHAVGADDGNGCRDVFVGSRLYYANRAVEKHGNDVEIQPQFSDVAAERALVSKWNKPPADVPNRIMSVFPEGVHLINHQMSRPANATTVKLGEAGETALMARAHYSYTGRKFSTNVTFSSRALTSNLINMDKPDSKNWLVGEDAVAAILYLHGGGTKSTGGHTAETLINHFKTLNIDVVSLDLPWHAEGHRDMLPHLEAELKALSAFVQKYIPSNVPVFVWGHSWGAVWAEALMRMTDRPHSEFSFHHNLTGVMIMAPAVDAAPGRSMREKLKEYQRRIERSRNELSHLYTPREAFIWPQMVEQGKTSPIPGLFSLLSVVSLDQTSPAHRGEHFIPALMVVGKGDPLVYVGFENLFDVYKGLKNVETHFLDELPIKDSHSSEPIRVGHLLREYADRDTQIPIDIKLASDFIAKQIGVKHLEKRSRDLPFSGFISTVQEYANNLAFREYVGSRNYFVTRSTKVYGEISKARTDVATSLRPFLVEYFFMPTRLKQALEKLAASKSEQEYIDALEEIQTFLQPHFSTKFPQDIVRGLLRFNMEEEASVVRQWAEEFLKDEQFINFFNQPVSQKRIKSLVRKITEQSPNIGTSIAIVREEQLPKKIERLIVGYLVRIFEMTDILRSTYIPTFESISQRSTYDLKDKSRIEARINSISNNVDSRRLLQSKLEKTSNRLKELRNENMALLTEVRHHIRIIKVAFDESAREIPDSLKEPIIESQKELERLEGVVDQLNEAVENAFMSEMSKSNDPSLSMNVFNEVISRHTEAINEFASQYESFATHRRHLRRDLIVAIEKGEMGEEYKEAVLAIYGVSSGGHRPSVGTRSLYLRLERNIEDMAELEAEYHAVKSSLSELNTNYQELFASLLQLIQLHDSNDVLAKVPQVHIYYSNTIRQMLTRSAAAAHLTPQKQRQEQLDYVRTGENDFQQIYNKDWRRELRSDLPPLLPTSGAMEL